MALNTQIRNIVENGMQQIQKFKKVAIESLEDYKDLGVLIVDYVHLEAI